MSIHVLMISQYFPPDAGGGSTRTYNTARSLIDKGCNVTVICAFPHYPYGHIPGKYKHKIFSLEDFEGIKLIRTWVPKLAHSSNAKRVFIHFSFILSSLWGLLFVRNVDIIFSMNPNFFAFFSAWFYKTVFHKNLIRNVDDLWPETFYDLGIVKSKWIKKFLDYIASLSYKKSSFVIPAAEGYVEILLKKYQISPKKISVIRQGVDTKMFHHEKNQPRLKDGSKTVMYAGIINAGYDFEPVIQAAKILEGKPISFVIKGYGNDLPKLRKIIKKYKVKNVKLKTEFMSKDELVSFMNKADIFLLPLSDSGDRGMPTKTLEYQALGKPIVCVSHGETKKYILETRTGLVTESKDPEELVKLIMKLVDDTELTKKLGNNGINHVKKNLNLDVIGRRFMDIINKNL